MVASAEELDLERLRIVGVVSVGARVAAFSALTGEELAAGQPLVGDRHRHVLVPRKLSLHHAAHFLPDSRAASAGTG